MNKTNFNYSEVDENVLGLTLIRFHRLINIFFLILLVRLLNVTAVGLILYISALIDALVKQLLNVKLTDYS